MEESKTKNDTQVRLLPRELNEFHQLTESGKSDILLGKVLKAKKCIGINVTNMPRIININWYKDKTFVIDHMHINRYSWYEDSPIKIVIIVPKDKTIWKWDTI